MRSENGQVLINVKSPITVRSTPYYSAIVSDADDTRHFFLEKDGRLFYDGNCKDFHTEENPEEIE